MDERGEPSLVGTDDSASGQQINKATASGWIGSVLEYYDFFIYATATSLVFPQLFFPTGNPSTAIIASMATYGVGYIARPIGAFFLGRYGDMKGRKRVLLLSMFLMGFSTMAVGLLPTYQQIGILAPVSLVILRLIQGFAVAGEFSGSSSMILEHAPFGRRGFYASFTLQGIQAGQILAAAIFLPLVHFMPEDTFLSVGWRVPFLISALVIIAAFYIRRGVQESPAFSEEIKQGDLSKTPITEAIRYHWQDMVRIIAMSLMNVIPLVATVFGAAYAVQPAYGIQFHRDVYLWIPVAGNIVAVAVIPLVGGLADRLGRRPPIIFAALACGLMAFLYLYAISIRDLPMAILSSLVMWGIVYQGYNAVFPSFYPELFPTRVRVSAVSISQNVGTTLTALLPVLFAAVAPPGTVGIPLRVGAITLGITLLAAIGAYTARETYRVRLHELGDRHANPVSDAEYARATGRAKA